MDVGDLLQWVAIATLATEIARRALRGSGEPGVDCESGPRRGMPLPPATARRIGYLPPGSPGLAIAFVREGCGPCARLLGILAAAENGLRERVVVVVLHPTRGLVEALRETGVRVIADRGRLWAECRVREAPIVVWVGPDGTVVDKAVTERIDRFVGRILAENRRDVA